MAAKFKVGDKVRLVKDGRSTTGAIGKFATIRSWGSKLIDNNEYLLEIDPPHDDYSTLSVDPKYTRAKADCFELVQPLTIQAGRCYKTRDGRKVGPMERNRGEYDLCYTFTVSHDFVPNYGKAWRDDGTFGYNRKPHNADLIAEWVDEPAAAEPKSKFKVGDRVNYLWSRDAWQNVEIVEANNGLYKADDKRLGRGAFSDRMLELASPSPAIVALIENGQPRPATRPFVHRDRASAEREAARLAAVHKGQEFGVYEFVSSAKEAKVYEHEWQRLAADGCTVKAACQLRDSAGLHYDAAREAVASWLRQAA